MFILASFVSIAATKSGTIPVGYTMTSKPLIFTDTLSASQADTIDILNYQKYLQHQTVTIDLDSVDGAPSVACHLYGKVTSIGSWVEIGTPITWTTEAHDGSITSAAPLNYNFLRLILTASGTAQKVKIVSVEFKTANVYDVGSASAYVFGNGTGTVAINSSDWDITTAGVCTGLGAITSNGKFVTSDTVQAVTIKASSHIIGAGFNFATAAMVTGAADSIAITNVAFPTLAAGIEVSFIAEAANTTATRLDYNGTVKDLKEYNGAISALDGNDIRSGQYVKIAYDGAQWVMISPSGN